MLAEKPRHGYEIIKALGERVGGGYSPSPGVVYPTLSMIEDMGYATTAQEQGGRKLYTLTADGEAFLAENKAQIDAIFSRLDGAEGARQGDFGPVLRAMENLRWRCACASADARRPRPSSRRSPTRSTPPPRRSNASKRAPQTPCAFSHAVASFHDASASALT